MFPSPHPLATTSLFSVFMHLPILDMGFLVGASGKEPTGQCKRPKRWGLIPALGRSPGGGQDNPLQCSCLENPTDGGSWWATVPEVTKSRT